MVGLKKETVVAAAAAVVVAAPMKETGIVGVISWYPIAG